MKLTRLRRLWHTVASNLRYKLLVLVLVPMLLLAPTVLLLSSYWAWKYAYEQMYLKVNTDLSVAHDIFHRIQGDQRQALKSLAESYEFRSDFDDRNFMAMSGRLSALRSQYGMDFLNVLNVSGTARMGETGWHAWQTKESPLVNSAAEYGYAAVGIEIYSSEEIARENPLIQNKTLLPLVATPRSVPTEKTVEDRAMLIRVVQPIRNRTGEVKGLLEGGVLLNRNFRLVDEIRDLVYGPGSLVPGSRGTVTVFIDDVRITTNVPSGDKLRALGTRASREVRETVLENQKIWVNRSFVVNDWYISAYEPIIDVHGDSVGMLYAGYLESPSRVQLQQLIMLLGIVLLLGTLFAAAVAILGAQSIFKPIELIANVIRATKSGKTRRIGALASRDEVGELAREFDSMLDSLEENQQRIQFAADELERKVAERTIELSDKNKRLEQTITLLRETRQQLAMAEKLAALGELIAGVAHEINNPTAVILGNMDVVMQELGNDASTVQIELDLIIEQVYRIRNIVDRLLQYSRPASFAGYVDELDIRDVLGETMLLVKHEIDRKHIQVKENYADLGLVELNRQELQQVLVNLLLNAAHAVETQGTIELTTESWGQQGIRLKIRDNGCGIPADEQRRIFDPFYTSRKAGGTGLGLSVSYGIIRRYGGHITVSSLLGEWTEFVIKIRFRAVYESDEEMLQEMNSTIRAD